MDESNKQHEQEKLEGIPAKPGKLKRFDTSYEKNGVSNIFLSFEPLTGKRWINLAERRTRIDWARQIQELVEVHYPNAKKILLVIDTPKHGSWLNRAEIELSHLFRQCLNRRLANIEEVRKEASAWMHDRNKKMPM